MAQSTRSQTHKNIIATGSTTIPTATATTSSHGTVLSQAEVELLHKQLDEREKLIRDQVSAMRREREELDKQQTSSTELATIIQALNQLQTDITPLKYLPERIDSLEHRVGRSPHDQSQSLLPNVQKATPAATPQMCLKIKDVMPNIPCYDGYKMSVFQFSRACERAKALLPPAQELQLVQLIINKLEGDAYQLIEGNHFDTVTSLLDKLKTIFAPYKSVYQYRGELANMYKLPNETMLNYAGRVKNLKAAILDCYRRQRGDIDNAFSDEVDNEVLEAFINGLPSDLITRIEHRPIENLEQAIEWAAKLSQAMAHEKSREKRSISHTFSNTKFSRADPYYPQSAPERVNQPVKILTRPPDAPRPFVRPLIPGVPGPNSPNVCRYCKFPGHDISACRKLAYRNAQQNSGNAQGDPSAPGVSQGTAQNIARPAPTVSRPGPSREK